MNIGEAATESGVSAKMIRYYESIGLVPKVARTESGYRVYSENDIHTLRFVRRARDLGFSVEQIGELLSLWQNHERASKDVKRVALTHVETLRQKVQELEDMIETLTKLAERCHGDNRPDCPIIENLASPHCHAAPAKPRSRGEGLRNSPNRHKP
ncbi:MAG: Cu(I)-responsive transcriptional regulator [Alphaproteobacteria bacterium]